MQKLFLLSLLFLLNLSSEAQTVYQLVFNQKIEGQVVSMNTLFIQNEDDSGFVRMRYTDATSKQDVIIEAELQEEAFLNADGSENDSQIYIKTINPIVHTSERVNQKPTPIFLFQLNKETQFLEPISLIEEDVNGMRKIAIDANLYVKEITPIEMTKPFLGTYFFEDDQFMSEYFESNTKNISPTHAKMKLYLLIVADTLATDIGSNCAFDAKRITTMFKQISDYIGCQFSVRNVMGKNYSKKELVSQLKLLVPSENDIVIFYYSGHGFRKDNDSRRYPYLDLRLDKSVDLFKETMNMENIYSALQKKKAKFTLILSDCCNTYLKDPVTFTSQLPLKKKSMPINFKSEHINQLFLNPKQSSILAVAADSTQFATSNANFGGFFSYYLEQNIMFNCGKTASNPSWYQILETTKTQTFKMSRKTKCKENGVSIGRCYQIPCFRITK